MKSTLNGNEVKTFAAILEDNVMFTHFKSYETELLEEESDMVQDDVYSLSVFKEGQSVFSFVYCASEYEGVDDRINLNHMLECIWADIIGMIDREKDFDSDEDV